MLEIQSFVSLKNESLLIWTRAHLEGTGGGRGGEGGSQVLQNFEGEEDGGGGAHKEGV